MQKVDIVQPVIYHETLRNRLTHDSIHEINLSLSGRVSAIIDDRRSWFQFSQWLRPQSGQTAWFAEMDR